MRPSSLRAILGGFLGTIAIAFLAVVDPFEPPMPPKTTLKQARRFADSLVRGQPNREKVVATILENRVRELV